MAKNPGIKVFIDTSAFIAGLASSRGAAREVLRLAEAGLITVFMSKQVIVEADRNIESKFPELLPDYREYLSTLAPILVDDPPLREVRKYTSVINAGDAPILTAAVSSKADYLITWDKKHFVKSEVKRKVPVIIVTPAEFLKAFRSYIEGLQ